MVPGIQPDPDWFSVPTLELARKLIGTLLIHEQGVPDVNGRTGAIGGIIVETEAYLTGDPASHAFRGKTQRNAAMFRQPGTAYVYRIYGIHHCINVVGAPSGIGEAVLIRALEPVWGIDVMIANRGGQKNLCSGPGRLCQALAISTGKHNGTRLTGEGPISIRLDDTGRLPAQTEIVATRRIGVSTGIENLWRFVAAGHPALSRPVQPPMISSIRSRSSIEK